MPNPNQDNIIVDILDSYPEPTCIFHLVLILLGFLIWFSVVQSDGISFCDDVVLDCVNMACRDEDNSLDQIYEKQIFLNFYYEI